MIRKLLPYLFVLIVFGGIAFIEWMEASNWSPDGWLLAGGFVAILAAGYLGRDRIFNKIPQAFAILFIAGLLATFLAPASAEAAPPHPETSLTVSVDGCAWTYSFTGTVHPTDKVKVTVAVGEVGNLDSWIFHEYTAPAKKLVNKGNIPLPASDHYYVVIFTDIGGAWHAANASCFS